MMFTDLLPSVLDIHILQWKNIFFMHILWDFCSVRGHLTSCPAGEGWLGVLGFPCAGCCSMWFGRLMLLFSLWEFLFFFTWRNKGDRTSVCHPTSDSSTPLNLLTLCSFRLWNNLQLTDSKIWLGKFWFLTFRESSVCFCVLQVF